MEKRNEDKLVKITSEKDVDRIEDEILRGGEGSGSGSESGGDSGTETIQKNESITVNCNYGSDCVWLGTCACVATLQKVQSGTNPDGSPLFSYIIQSASYNFTLVGKTKKIIVHYTENGEDKTREVLFTPPSLSKSSSNVEGHIISAYYEADENVSYVNPRTNQTITFKVTYNANAYLSDPLTDNVYFMAYVTASNVS